MPSIEMLESVVLRDCGRHIERLAGHTGGDLDRAAVHLARSNGGVAVATGFAVQTADGPIAETDGPIGAAALVGALSAAGRSTVVLTDDLNTAACVAALAVYGIGGEQVRVVSEDGVSQARDDLTAMGVETIVYIERLGPNASGKYLSMRGVDLTDSTVPLDGLAASFHSIGIGDGGNEIGMGKLPNSAVAETIDRGGDIHCAVATDELILAGVSNWGAWALVAALAMTNPAYAQVADAALSVDLWEAALRAVVGSGAVDGVALESVPSVDGFDPPIHTAVLTAIRVIAGLG